MTANPAQGWVLAPDPERPYWQTASGRLAIRCELTYNGRLVEYVDYVLDECEARELHAWLGDVLGVKRAPHAQRRADLADSFFSSE